MTDSDDGPTVPVVCEACGTTKRVALDDVGDTIEGHNERVHDGDEEAEVDPDLAAELQRLVAADVADLE